MTHSLGVYYAAEHSIPADRDYIAKLQPRILRILDPDVQHIADMHALCPNAIIAPRTWAIDDGSDEDHPSKQVNRLMADPVGTAHDHAQQYKAQWDRWQQEAAQRGLKLPPVERVLFNSANEPNQGGTAEKIAAYSVAFLDRCTELGIRACAPCLGVGWPANNGPGTAVDWTPYINAGLEQAIKRNGGMLSVHEYFYKTGPQDGWGWLAGRHLQCPLDVPIVLGEIGIDNYVYNKRWQAEPEETRGNRGWQGNVSPDQYAEMIEWHIRHCDKRVVSALIFITDVRNNSWESFNTRPAHGALLARKDNMIPQAQPPAQPQTPPQSTHIPTISTGAPAPVQPTHYVRVRDGAYLRTAPDLETGVVVEAIPYLDMVTVNGYDTGSDGKQWARTWHVDGDNVWTGWVRGDLLEMIPEDGTPPAPAPSEPVATGIIDPLTALAFLDVESGNRAFTDGLLTIRFEVHRFKANLKNDALFDKHFKFTPGKYAEQYWRPTPDSPWIHAHGSMAERHKLLNFAMSLNQNAALRSTGMGMAQVMGENHKRIGYSNPAAMFKAFSHPKYGVNAQLMGFVDYVLSDPALFEALRERDWMTAVQKYNGTGQEHIYIPALENARKEINQEVGA